MKVPYVKTAAIVLAATALLAAVAVTVARPNLENSYQPIAAKGHASLSPCGASPAVIGFVARLRPGYSVSQLTSVGLHPHPLSASTRSNTSGLPSVGDSEIVVAGSSSTDLNALQKNAAVAAAGEVLAQSADATLLSCDQHLSDKPKAVVLRDAAIDALVAEGAASRSVLTADSTSWTLSADPLDGKRVFLTAYIPGGVVSNPAASAAGQMLLQSIPLVAVLDKSTGSPIQVGFGSWDAQ